MFQLSKIVEKAEQKVGSKYKKYRNKIPRAMALCLFGLYFYGMLICSIDNGIKSTFGDSNETLLSWNPLTNILSVFSPTGLGVSFIILILFLLITKRGYSLISGYKTIKDKERGIEILPEGTHGTSGWMPKTDMLKTFDVGTINSIKTPLLAFKSY